MHMHVDVDVCVCMCVYCVLYIYVCVSSFLYFIRILGQDGRTLPRSSTRWYAWAYGICAPLGRAANDWTSSVLNS
jgi:hypothetical protein